MQQVNRPANPGANKNKITVRLRLGCYHGGPSRPRGTQSWVARGKRVSTAAAASTMAVKRPLLHTGSGHRRHAQRPSSGPPHPAHPPLPQPPTVRPTHLPVPLVRDVANEYLLAHCAAATPP